MSRVQIHVDADVGFVWSGAMANSTTMVLNVSYDDAQVRLKETEGYIGEVSQMVRWLGEPTNWDRKVSEATEAWAPLE